MNTLEVDMESNENMETENTYLWELKRDYCNWVYPSEVADIAGSIPESGIWNTSISRFSREVVISLVLKVRIIADFEDRIRFWDEKGRAIKSVPVIYPISISLPLGQFAQLRSELFLEQWIF